MAITQNSDYDTRKEKHGKDAKTIGEFMNLKSKSKQFSSTILTCYLVFLTNCSTMHDGEQRRILQCQMATLELEDAQRGLRSALITGNVKYTQLERLEIAIDTINHCVIELSRKVQ